MSIDTTFSCCYGYDVTHIPVADTPEATAKFWESFSVKGLRVVRFGNEMRDDGPKRVVVAVASLCYRQDAKAADGESFELEGVSHTVERVLKEALSQHGVTPPPQAPAWWFGSHVF